MRTGPRTRSSQALWARRRRAGPRCSRGQGCEGANGGPASRGGKTRGWARWGGRPAGRLHGKPDSTSVAARSVFVRSTCGSRTGIAVHGGPTAPVRDHGQGQCQLHRMKPDACASGCVEFRGRNNRGSKRFTTVVGSNSWTGGVSSSAACQTVACRCSRDGARASGGGRSLERLLLVADGRRASKPLHSPRAVHAAFGFRPLAAGEMSWTTSD